MDEMGIGVRPRTRAWLGQAASEIDCVLNLVIITAAPALCQHAAWADHKPPMSRQGLR